MQTSTMVLLIGAVLMAVLVSETIAQRVSETTDQRDFGFRRDFDS